jgi:tRNA(Ile)-lysidine synthase
LAAQTNISLINRLEKIFSANFSALPKKILIALSGGIDSLCLSLALQESLAKYGIELHNVTINHNLRSNSATEALTLNKLMLKLGFKHKIIDWQHQKEIANNIENKARIARYNLLKSYATEHNIKMIVTGHHLDDQVETFFMRLIRGSGIDGLAAMNMVTKLDNNLILFRPFLEISKSELKSYLIAKKQSWFEDETNKDSKFLRNKIRKFLYQIEDKQLLDNRIKQTTSHLKRAKDFLESYSEEKLLEISNITNIAIDVNYNKFITLHEEIALRILVKIFIKLNNNLDDKFIYADKKYIYKPRFNNLYQLYNRIINLEQKKQHRMTFAHSIITIKDNNINFSKEKKPKRQ